MRSIAAEFRIAAANLLDWRSCLLSKFVLLLGITYLFIPLDIIPDSTPIFGHWDEAGFVLAGFVGSRLLISESDQNRFLDNSRTKFGRTVRPGPLQRLQFVTRVARADHSNFFLYQYRGVHAFLVTGKNSGTHWLKFMLSCGLARQHGVLPPRHASGNDADAIISHPRWPHRYPGMPRIGSSHTIPSIAFSWLWLTRPFPFRPVVVLVRDIKAAMVSHYVKWQREYEVTFAHYVRGDPSGKRYRADLWWFVHFFNRWGDLASAHPGTVLVVRYEDLQSNPEATLRRIAAHLRVDLNEDAVATALRFVSRDAIRGSLDPTNTEIIVPPDDTGPAVTYSPEDDEFIHNTFTRYLRHDFGYGDPVRLRPTP
jgi:Sulfotransferase family/Protein of unknown function (DUF1232)